MNSPCFFLNQRRFTHEIFNVGCRRTLILSGGAGKDAMIKVIKDYYFLDAFDFNKSLAGRTDSDIIKSVVTRLRGRCNSAEAAGLLIRYHMELPKQLPLHKGRVLKNVEKTLQYFCRPDSRYCNCLLTGNTSTGAHLKLQHFGLDQYFNHEHSVFGEISENREMLAKVAFHRLYMQNEQAKPNELILSAIHLTTCAVPMPSAHPA